MVNNKRIVFIIGSMRKGGAERVISILANDYAERGWQVDIIMLLDDDCEYPLNANVNLISIKNNNQSRLVGLSKWIFGIRNYVRRSSPDKIVSFIARINIITIMACIGLNKSIIISERNDPRSDGRSIIVKLLTLILYPLANYVIFQTKWAQSCFPKGIQKKSAVISNPIQVLSKLNNVKAKKIVAVGRLVEQKNHALLINAFRNVNEKFPDYKLYIYGEGGLRETLLNQIRDLKLTESVILPGNVDNIHEKIADAELYVLSSNYEGLSNALLEAMMMGLPCISTNCAGSNEVVKNGINGLLVKIGDEVELTNAICTLINDNEFSQILAKQAKVSTEHMNFQNVLRDWHKIINTMN